MEVEVQIQRGAANMRSVRSASRAKLGREALDEGDCATLLNASAPLSSHASAQLCEQGAEAGAEHFACELRVVRTAVPEQIGEREHPLTDGPAAGPLRGIDKTPYSDLERYRSL
jgi:hypothetical protein